MTLIVSEHHFCFRGHASFRKIQVQLEIAQVETLAIATNKRYLKIENVCNKSI